MKNILLLGSGMLNKIIFNEFLHIGYNVDLLSVRKGDLKSPVRLEKNIHYHYVIDSLDLPSANYDFYDKYCQHITHFRETIPPLLTFGRYIYISSASVYKDSFGLIDENSAIINDHDKSPYVTNKLYTEESLSSLFVKELSILRPCALWDFDYSYSTPKGFFVDLIRARNSNYKLKLKEGDSKVITYMNYQDIKSLLVRCIMNDYDFKNIQNITSMLWASRKSLKSGIRNESDDTNIGKRIFTLG